MPIACQPKALSHEQRERQHTLLLEVRGKVQETRELPDGVDLRLPTDMVLFRDVAEWIALERTCCPFLSFSLRWEADDQVWVAVSGGADAKAVIAAEILGR